MTNARHDEGKQVAPTPGYAGGFSDLPVPRGIDTVTASLDSAPALYREWIPDARLGLKYKSDFPPPASEIGPVNNAPVAMPQT
jgi:hypothetical protein